LTHASCIEFRANKEAVKTLLLSTVWQNAVNIQSLLNRMSFWIIIIMHMVTALCSFANLGNQKEKLLNVSINATFVNYA
jgi:uncharacterized membrane protein YhaH (DUF805 family)